MCLVFGLFWVGLCMWCMVLILLGFVCCVYGFMFILYFYGVKCLVGYVLFDFEILVIGKLFEDIVEVVY